MQLWCLTTPLTMLSYEVTKGYTRLSQIVVDEETGDVYIGGKNVLYKFNEHLSIMDSHLTGPVLDSINYSSCASEPCDDAVLTDNDAVILEMHPVKKYLLFCGTVRQGLCTVYDRNNFNRFNEFDANNVINLVGSREGAVAFFGTTNLVRSSIGLYVGSSYDGRPLQFSGKAISARRITQHDMSYVFHNTDHNVISAIDIDSHHKQDYIIKYIYGFEFEGFSYFVTVQSDEIPLQRYSTRLVRVCQRDPAFYSYTEVTITCRGVEYQSMKPKFYNIAQAAWLGAAGRELKERFNWAENEQVLYIVFGKSRFGESVVNKEEGSGVCMYTMSDVKRSFVTSQKDCYQGRGNLLPWINSSVPRCTVDVSFKLFIIIYLKLI